MSKHQIKRAASRTRQWKGMIPAERRKRKGLADAIAAAYQHDEDNTKQVPLQEHTPAELEHVLTKFFLAAGQARERIGLRHFQVIDEAVRPKSMKAARFRRKIEEIRVGTLMVAICMAMQNGYKLVPLDDVAREQADESVRLQPRAEFRGCGRCNPAPAGAARADAP